MELKFIWVKDYRILDKIGFNFSHSGNHKFRYENNTLNLLDNNKSILNFGKNITGVTALAGQNGSGKSSFCEIILYSTATLVDGSMGFNQPFDGIVCYGDHIFYHHELDISNLKELEDKQYKLVKFKDTPFEDMKPEWRDSFVKGGFIYYSNIIDWRSGIDGINLANISTQALLEKDYSRTDYGIYDKYDHLISDEFRYRDKLTSLQALDQTEGYRNMVFYLNFPEFIPFSKPSNLIIQATYPNNNRFLNYDRSENYENSKILSEYERYIYDFIHTITVDDTHDKIYDSDHAKLRKAAKILYRFNLLISECLRRKIWPDGELARLYLFENGSPNGLFEEVEKIITLLSLHERIIDKGSFREQYSPNQLQHEHGVTGNWRFFIIENLYVENTDEIRALMKQFIAVEETAINLNENTLKRITNYQMLPFKSSGENSFYSFFARLSDTIQRYDKGRDNRDSLILFIDEGEVGFHPAWKKKYLKWILDFLTGNFSHYKFQIILTTHSPYLLSDLSSENVILIKKGENSKTEIVPSGSFSTFGSNIHNILSDNFFLNDGTIGEFAKKEIQKVIDILNKCRQLSKEALAEYAASDAGVLEKNNTYEIINIIGDNIVRNKLFEMYYEIFEDNDTIDKELASLAKKIDELKKRKK